MNRKNAQLVILVMIFVSGCSVRDWIGRKSKTDPRSSQEPRKWHWDDNLARDLRQSIADRERKQQRTELREQQATHFDRQLSNLEYR